MSEEAFKKARSKIHDIYKRDSFDFQTMCDLFDSLVEIENTHSLQGVRMNER